MKVLDRYLVKELIIPIFYSSLSLVLLILVADLFDNLDDFLRHKTTWDVIFKYYLALIPYAFIQTISWAAWMGALFLLVNFGIHNELTAMKAAGLQITSIVRPILYLGFLLGIFTFVVSDKILPRTTKISTELKETRISPDQGPPKDLKDFQNVTYFSGDDQIYFFKKFSPAHNEVEGIVALWLGTSDVPSRQTMVAKRGVWKDGIWTFENVTEHQMDVRGRILGDPQTFPQKNYPEISFTPHELAISSMDTSFLNYRELGSLIKRLDENGVSVHSELVEFHSRLSAPWQGLVMMLIAIPFLAKTTNRKLIAMNVLYCVVAIFAYHVLSAVGIAMGKAGKFLPFLSAWFGNICFSVAAIFYLEKANY